MKLSTIWVLLVLFQLKHFFADYLFQNKYMLGKFKEQDWELPLTAHVAVHALFTFALTFPFGVEQAACLAIFDAVVHFAMDRVKASKSMLGRFQSLTPATIKSATKIQWKHNDYFWWSLGFDQMIHHLTHYAIIGWLIHVYN